MGFKDFLNNFQYDPDNFDIEKFKAEALSEYTSDEGVFNAKINDVTTTATETAAELARQKVRNYDLLNKIPTGNKANPAEQQKQDDDDADISIDDLFGVKES